MSNILTKNLLREFIEFLQHLNANDRATQEWRDSLLKRTIELLGEMI